MKRRVFWQMPDLIYNKERKEMSEDNKQNFIEKLKKDKKFRFELIIGIWSGVISVILVVAVVFVAQAYIKGSNTVPEVEESQEAADHSPVIVSDPAVGAEETKPPYKSAIINHNEEDFLDGEDEVDGDLKSAKTAYATTVINLRKEPALTADVIAKLQVGDEVTILDFDKEWTKVNFDGSEGYVSTIYLSTRKPSEQPEVSEPVRTSAPTARPTSTPKPVKTAKPTKKPKKTKTPKKTKAPTKEPDITKEPDPTKAPEPTKAPDPTKAPEPTKAPDPTKAPEPTKEPDSTKAPDPTQSSENVG